MHPLRMTQRIHSGVARVALVAACLALPAFRAIPVQQEPQCAVDLTNPGQMSDIVSNALCLGLGRSELEIRAFLDGSETRYVDGSALVSAAAERFSLPESELSTWVERYRHCNCAHPGGGDPGGLRDAADATGNGPFELTRFASDVTLHVVLHELGHALVREFDLPVLGNEETLADAFATHYLTAHLPERAVAVLTARTRSLMIEAEEVPRTEWAVSGEHNSDARRAFQIAALALAADPEKFRPVAAGIGMTASEMRSASDYGTEIHRSWRRTLAPLWMPSGTASTEARLAYDSDSEFARQVRSSDIASVLETAVRRFDWHSQVTIRFADGDGGAAWSRSGRTITVHRGYVERFARQGRQVPADEAR